MDHPLIDLIDAKVREAEAEGAFNDLPGAGKPLPEDQAGLDYLARTMQRNGVVPEFVLLQKELVALRGGLPDLPMSERRVVLKKIADLEPRIALAKEAWTR